jgi:glycosyltransferase involved in cell wall biosynthesis
MTVRVLIIESSGNLWGSERALLDLIDNLKDCEIAVCCPPDVPLIDALNRRDVRVLPYLIADLHLKSRWARLGAALAVLRACLRFRPSLIYLNQAGVFKVCMPAANLLGLPICAHVRIFDDVDYLARQSPAPHRLAAIIAISEAIDQAIAAQPALASISRHRLYDAYAPSAPKPSALRRQARVACVGRIAPVKGQDLLIAALESAPEAALGEEYIVAGGGNAEMTARLEARSRKLSRPVRWVGVLNDVEALLMTCGVLVCPSRREPLGRVIFEAWDAGSVPVVFASSGGAAEIVSASGGGIVVPVETPQALAAGLAKAVALTPSEVATMVEGGRAWMAANVAPEAYGADVSALFKAVADGSTKISLEQSRSDLRRAYGGGGAPADKAL